MNPFTWAIVVIVLIILISIKQINQYQKGVKFTLGKYAGMMDPGWRLVFPIIQSYQKVDLRTKAVDVPNQEAITKDNISVGVNAVIYYKVQDAAKVILEVEDYRYAISQMAQTTMRNVVGQVDLDDLLSQRDRVSESIRSIIDLATDPWGIKVGSVELKDIALPEEMKRVISKQAEAEREKRAKIIAAEGEFLSSQKLADTADIMQAHPIALQLRNLQTMAEISVEKNSTIIFPAQFMGTLNDIQRFMAQEKKS